MDAVNIGSEAPVDRDGDIAAKNRYDALCLGYLQANPRSKVIPRKVLNEFESQIFSADSNNKSTRSQRKARNTGGYVV